MRRVVLLALSLVVTGCSSVTYNCNVPDSCPRAPKPGVAVTILNTPHKASPAPGS